MTNTIALGLALLILAIFAADFLWFDGVLPVFLGQKMLELTEYVAFWR